MSNLSRRLLDCLCQICQVAYVDSVKKVAHIESVKKVTHVKSVKKVAHFESVLSLNCHRDMQSIVT